MATAESATPLDALRGSQGFTMVALDQRESLRAMFAGAGVDAADADLQRFKREAIATLSPHTSAILTDRQFGVPNGRPADLAPDCALILAADVLHANEAGAITRSTVDPTVTPELIADVGAVALKYLVIWYPDQGREERAKVVGEFMNLCAASNTASVLEGIVKPAPGQEWTDGAARDAAVRDAAVELAGFGPDLYKGEVPGYRQGDLSLVAAESKRVTELIDCPWVVLSNGVAAPEFSDAVDAACAGGAGGFLAGRAIWKDTVGEPDPVQAMRERSIPRLTELRRIVGAHTP